MNGQRQPYITLDSCILDYLNESEQSNNKYGKVFHIAFRGFEQLGLDFFYTVKSLKLPINDNFTVTLPDDYLNWTKVGILNNRSEIVPLCYNDNMTTYADLSPDRISKTEDNTLSLSQWDNNTWVNFYDGFGYSNVYGVPSGEPFVGQFKIDTNNGVILLNNNFVADYLILEYVSSPLPDNEYFIPVQFREALIAWIWWKDGNAKSARSHMELGARRDWRHEFYNERRNAIARWKPIRKSEIYEASQQMTRLAIKS